jgi:hypothetical protein
MPMDASAEEPCDRAEEHLEHGAVRGDLKRWSMERIRTVHQWERRTAAAWAVPDRVTAR